MTWKRSSYCPDITCVEAAGPWKRSSRCSTGACVEVTGDAPVLVRDGKLGGSSPVLSFEPAAWRAFIAGIDRL